MKKILFLFLALSAMLSYSQSIPDYQWEFYKKIVFPASDSAKVNPFLGAISENGTFYVVSSKATRLTANNAVYWGRIDMDTLKLFIDYDKNKDSDTLTGIMGMVRGVAAFGNSVLIVGNAPYPRTKPNALSAIYVYHNLDTNQVEKFGHSSLGLSGAGYGSWIHGGSVTKDTILFTGITFGTSFRAYNFSHWYKGAARGSWILPNPTNPNIFSNVMEPGGPEQGGVDVIRDVAMLPNGDYNDTNTVFYTSRNSRASALTGGIAVWKGGTQTYTLNYKPKRVQVPLSEFDFTPFIPYGIYADVNGILWVAGPDTTRKWVKGYYVEGDLAVPISELPSSTSMSDPKPDGAPFAVPTDVFLTHSTSYAFVVDAGQKCVWVFKNTLVSAERELSKNINFDLKQNYPNPFNPTTVIEFSIPQEGYVTLTIYNSLGQKIQELVNGNLRAGVHVKFFTANNLPSGVYYYKLTYNGSSLVKKMILTK